MREDWEKIETDYIGGKQSYREIAQKYGLAPSTVARQGKKRKWPEKRAQFARKVQTRKRQKTAEKKASREAAALLRVEALGIEVQQVMDKDAAVAQLMTEIKQLRLVISRTKAEPAEALLSLVSEKRQSLQAGRKSSAMSAAQQRILRQLMQYLSEEADQLNGVSAAETLPVLKKDFDARVKALKAQAETVSKRMTNMFDFSEIIFGEGQELLIIVTELTANRDTAAFISKFGCKEYYRHNKALLLYERQGEIAEALKDLKLN